MKHQSTSTLDLTGDKSSSDESTKKMIPPLISSGTMTDPPAPEDDTDFLKSELNKARQRDYHNSEAMAIMEQTILSLRHEAENLRARAEQAEAENRRREEEMEGAMMKFDRLSGQAFRKIRELVSEKGVLEVEMQGLRDQVNIFYLFKF